MNKYFSLSLYKEGLKRVRGVGIASALIVIVGNLIVPLGEWAGHIYFESEVVSEVKAVEALPLCYVMALLAPVIVLRMFSFLNSRSASDFYHAIPQKRICLYLCFAAAAVTWTVGITVVCGASSLIAWNLVPFKHLSLGTAARCVFSQTALALLTSGCALLGAAVAGNVFSAIFASAAVFGMPVLLINSFGNLIDEFYPAFCYEKSVFYYCGSKGFLPVTSTEDFYNPKGLPVIAAYVAFLLLAALAAYAFVKRKSETAEHSTCTPVLQHLLRLSAAFPIWLLVITLVLDGDYLEVIPFVLVSLIVYLVYELITVRGIKNAVKVLPLFLILPVFSAAFAAGAYGCTAVMRANDPKSVDDVSYVIIEGNAGSIVNIPLYEIQGECLTDPEVISAITCGLKFKAKSPEDEYSYDSPVYYYGNSGVQLKVALKNGKVLYRDSFPYGLYSKQLCEAFKNQPALYKKLFTLPEYGKVKIDVPKEAWELYRKEYEKLSDDDKLRVLLDEVSSDRVIYVYFEDEQGFYSRESYYSVHEGLFPETYKFLEEYYGDYKEE